MNYIILLIALVVPASAWLPWISSRRVTSTALLDKVSSSGLVDQIEEKLRLVQAQRITKFSKMSLIYC